MKKFKYIIFSLLIIGSLSIFATIEQNENLGHLRMDGSQFLDKADGSKIESGTWSKEKLPKEKKDFDSYTSVEIKKIQQELKDRDLYSGKIDGILGNKTSKAITTFQKNNGFYETGRLDEATFRSLTNPNSNVEENMNKEVYSE